MNFLISIALSAAFLLLQKMTASSAYRHALMFFLLEFSIKTSSRQCFTHVTYLYISRFRLVFGLRIILHSHPLRLYRRFLFVSSRFAIFFQPVHLTHLADSLVGRGSGLHPIECTSKARRLQNCNLTASRQVEFHQSVDCFVSRIDDVHQSLMSSDFKLITACLVDVRAAENIEALNSCRIRLPMDL